MPAYEYYAALSESDKAKVIALFRSFAERGEMRNREKFRKLGQKAKGEGSELFEFKSFQDRFIGQFRPGKRFIIVHAVRKKSANLPKPDIEKAVRLLRENDQRE